MTTKLFFQGIVSVVLLTLLVPFLALGAIANIIAVGTVVGYEIPRKIANWMRD